MFASRLEHFQAPQGCANTIPHRYCRGLTLAQISEEALHLGVVALFRKPTRSLSHQGLPNNGLFEILRRICDPRREGFDTLSSRRAAANSAVGKVADRSISKQEGRYQIVLSDRIFRASWQRVS